VRDQTQSDNSQGGERRAPGGGDSCRQGFVWREAFAGDHVCVSPETRAQARNDNSQAAGRIAASSPGGRGFGNDVIGCAADVPCVKVSSGTSRTKAEIFWDGHENFDFYQVRWAHEGGPENQVKINSGGRSGSFAVNPARAGTRYTFKVQGCYSRVLASSDCSGWGIGSLTTDQ
jgi:hypothetical protein